ncbi:hypothetical protein T03_5699 [Trichinella britovi]|uniref:Uncharacterized protein n=1 Tax=Trichinella britovi TaxID=45882 RepID=A0A0V1CR88_TRIBR|nr:hypothetical protein T03_5699 [Trichinella britovi]
MHENIRNLHNIALLRSIAILRHNACAITDGKLGCSSGGKSTSITLGYSVHCYAISLAGGQLQFRSSTPSVNNWIAPPSAPFLTIALFLPCSLMFLYGSHFWFTSSSDGLWENQTNIGEGNA